MTWYILMFEGLLIIAIVVWMVKKARAIKKTEVEEEIEHQGPDKPDLELPDEEKWE
jgi:uncharacterized membrane protein